MNLSYFKKIRVIISLIFFLALTAIFIDFRNLIPPNIQVSILYLQFVPSVLKILGGFTFAATGFFIVIALTVLFGRIYCSSICPLGTFQDIVFYISKIFYKKKKRFKFSAPHSIVRYSILSFTIIFYLSGSIFLLVLLDPYSNFGKIFGNIVRPVVMFSNNVLVSVLESFNIYSVYPYQFRGIGLITLGFPILFLLLVLFMSFYYGRLYCNTVCPVGAFLGIISKFSLFKIYIDKNSCKGCRVCEKVCKSNCINSREEKEIDFTRCVSCFNCLTVCPSDGISIGINTTEKKKNPVEVNDSKRQFISAIAAYFLGTSVISYAQNKIVPKKKSKIPVLKKYPVSPPGSKSLDHFKDACTACHLCISACPTQVLQPSFLEYGFLGMLQPRMDYNTSFCNFECTLCSQICPSGAISFITKEEKKTKQLGKVKFIKDNCIVYTENTDCGACSEHCPTKAVKMVPYKKLFAPETNDEICIGCGACEYACPVKPYKAIYVEGNPIHLRAKKPEIKKIEEKVDFKEDFPF